MAEYLPPVVASLTGDISDFLSKMEEAQAIIDSLDGTEIALTANAEDVLAEVEVAQEAIDSIDGDVPISANVDELLSEVEEAKSVLEDQDINLPLALRTAEAVAEAKAVVEGIDELKPWVEIQAALNQTSMAILGAELAVASAERTVDFEANLIDAYAETSIAALETQIEALGQPKPVIDLNITAAEAKIAILDAQLASLDATIAMAGGDAALASAGEALGGGGGASGGGGSSFWGSTLGTLLGGSGKGAAQDTLGFGAPLLPSIPIAGFGTLGSLAGLGPESLLGLAAGVGGSAVGAGIGATTLGASSLGVAGVGMGTDMAGIGQATGDVKLYNTALNNLNSAIAEYGQGSIEAQAAQGALNYTLASMPKAAQGAIVSLNSTLTQWTTLFDQATGVAEAKGAGIIASLVHTGEAFLPTIGKFASENMTIIQTSLQPFLTWIKGPGLQIFTELEKIFQEHLPTAMHAFEQGAELVLKVIGKFAPQTGGLITFLNNLFTKLNGPGFSGFTTSLQHFIKDFHTWWGLIKNVGDAIYELFHNDAGTGEAVISMLSKLVGEFDKWAKTVAGGDKLHNYMASHRQEVLALIEVIGKLIGTFGELHLSIGPVLMGLVGDILKFVNVLLKIPVVGTILGWSIVFLTLAHHIKPLWYLVKILGSGMASLLKSFAIDGINAFGSALSNLGGPLGKIGSWLSQVGQTAPSVEESMQAMVAAMDEMAADFKEAAAAMQSAAASIETAFNSVGVSADRMAVQVSAGIEESTASMAEAGAAANTMAAETTASLDEVGVAADTMGVQEDVAATSTGLLAGAMELLSSVGILIVVAGVYELIKHFGVLHGLMIAGGIAVLGLAAAFIILDAVPVVALVVGIALAVAGLVAGIIELVTHFKEVANFLHGPWGTAISAAIAVINPFIGIPMLIIGHWQAILSFFKTLWSGVKSAFNDVVSFLHGPWGTGMMAALAIIAPWIAVPLLLVTHWQSVVSFFEGIPGDVNHVWSDVVSALHSAWSSVANWVSSNVIQPVVNFFKGLPGKILDAVKDFGTLLLDAGKSLIDGLIHGVENEAKSAVDSVKHVGSDIVSGIKKVLGILSPSTVMTEVGGNVTKGLANGMQASSKQAIAVAQNISSQIIAAFGSLSGTGAVASSVQSLKSIFTNLANAFNSLASAAANAPGVGSDMKQLGTALSDMAKGLPSVESSLHKLTSGLSGFVSSKAVQTIGTVFGQINTVFQNLEKAIVSAANVTGPGITAMTTSLSTISKQAPKIAGDLNKLVKGFSGFTSSKAIQSIGTVFGQINTVFQNLGKAILTSANVTAPGIQSMVNSLGLISKAAPTIKSDLDTLAKKFQGFTQSKAITSIGTLFGQIGTVFTNVGKAIKDAGSVTGLGILAMGASLKLIDDAAPTIVGDVNSIIKAFSGLDATKTMGTDMTALGKVFSQLGGIFTDFGTLAKQSSSISGASMTAIVNGLTTISNYAPYIVTAIKKVEGEFSNLGNTKSLNTQLNALSTLFGTLSTIFGKVSSAAKAAGGDTPTAIGTIVTALTNLGTAITNLQTAVNGATPQILTAIQSMGTQIQQYLTGTLASSMVTIGTQIMSGLASGISSGSGAVVAAAQAVANAATAAVKAATKTSSPSQVFAAIGSDLMAGLAQGITGGSGLVSGALGNISHSMTSSAVPSINPRALEAATVASTATTLHVTTPIQLNGQTLATAVTQYQLRGARTTGNVYGGYGGGSQTAQAAILNKNAIQR